MASKKGKTKHADNSVNGTVKERPQNKHLKPWPKGVSGNPKGAPKRGQSWAETVKRIGDMTAPEAAAECLVLAKQLLELGDGVTLRDAAVLSAFRQLINDPDGRMFAALANRAEGNPIQPHANVDWKEEARKQGIDPDELSRNLIKQFTAAMVRTGDS